MWNRILWLFLLFILGHHLCFPVSPRYFELADSADYFIDKGNWTLAEQKILEALRLEPGNFSNSLLLSNLGLIQTQKGEYDKAIETLSLGLNIAPSSTVILNNRAHAYLLADNLQNAIRDLDKSLEIDSIQEWSLQTRAYIFLQQKNIQEAERLFHKVIEEFPANESAYSGLASIAESKGEINQALDLYRKGLEKNPNDEETLEAYIMLLIKSEKYSQARIELRNAIDKHPENAMFYLLRGYLHKLNYRNEEAQADKKIAISKGIDPEYASYFIP